MKKGFTLIELLVVIAIIAILAAILFPVFARAREKARQSSCLSNTKQIVLAFQMYLQDYDEITNLTLYGPNEVSWPYTFLPYMKNEQILKCPSDPSSSVAGYVSYAQPMHWGYYHLYKRSVTSSYGGGVPLAQIQYPAEVCAFGETATNAKNNGTFNTDGRWGYARWAPDRHNEGMNCGMVDGHAKWYGQSYLEAEWAKGSSSRLFADAD